MSEPKSEESPASKVGEKVFDLYQKQPKLPPAPRALRGGQEGPQSGTSRRQRLDGLIETLARPLDRILGLFGPSRARRLFVFVLLTVLFLVIGTGCSPPNPAAAFCAGWVAFYVIALVADRLGAKRSGKA